jgi:hypothetical protein
MMDFGGRNIHANPPFVVKHDLSFREVSGNHTADGKTAATDVTSQEPQLSKGSGMNQPH